MNLVILCGRVSKEIELRYTTGENQTAYAKFSLAVDKPTKGAGADFINCAIWGKLAEHFVKYVQKGQKILVRGAWQTGSYQGKNGRVFTNECIVDKFEFADGKKADNEGNIAEGGSDTTVPNLDFLSMDLGNDDVPFA